MKKQFLYLLLCTAFISCSDNVKFNNPALEGQKNNVFWRAVDTKATLINGVITIDGLIRNEKLTLIFPAPTAQVSQNNKNSFISHILGTSTTKQVTYIMGDVGGNNTFSTGLGIGNGQIIITRYDGVNNIISGTFKFNAKNMAGSSLDEADLNFQNGNFYVPLK